MKTLFLNGEWIPGSLEPFNAHNPASRTALPDLYATAGWMQINAALRAAQTAFVEVWDWEGETFAAFLEKFAELLSDNARQRLLIDLCHRETGFSKEVVGPELMNRTIGQMKAGAAAARARHWTMPTIDGGIRAMNRALGPIIILGPNNFPFAFNSAAGGDFVAAVLAGDPVIAIGHHLHPGTSLMLAEIAAQAAEETGMPKGFFQFLSKVESQAAIKMVADRRVGATAFTGSQGWGLQLKAAADAAGVPFYMEGGGANTVVVLPGALQASGLGIVQEFATSCLTRGGHMCTNPGHVLLLDGKGVTEFLGLAGEAFKKAPPAAFLTIDGAERFNGAVQKMVNAGARSLSDITRHDNGTHSNVLLMVNGLDFRMHPEEFDAECYGPSSLVVVAANLEEMQKVIDVMSRKLVGCIYAADEGDDAIYSVIEPRLRRRVGRLTNNKMPTGVAVTPAMHHSVANHPLHTSVGLPWASLRFVQRLCWDGVTEKRLPVELQNANAGQVWRNINGAWTLVEVV